MLNKLCFTVCALWFLTGCATVFTGMHDDITIKSEPAGARVMIDDLDYGKTPVTFPMKRDAMRQAGKRVTVQKDGYRDKEFQLRKELNYASLCNVGNVLFWGIDFITGAVLVYDPVSYSVILDPNTAASPSTAPAATPLAYTPKVGDPVDLLILSWGPATQTGVIEGKNKIMYQRLEGTYLITLTADRKIGDIQLVAR